MVAPPSTQGAAFHPSLLRPGEGERSPVPRNASRPLLARSGCRAVVVPSALRTQPPRRNRRRRATRSRRPDCPRRECVPPRRDALRDGADGTRLEGCGSAARLALVAEASPSKSRAWLSPRNSIANTRPTETVVGALQSHVYLRHSATTCGLELAHAPQLANTHPFDCHCP